MDLLFLMTLFEPILSCFDPVFFDGFSFFKFVLAIFSIIE